jgi:hypothetical protein
MNTQYLDDRHKANELTADALWDLAQLEDAFRFLGNEVVADKLKMVIFYVKSADHLHNDAFNQLFDSAYKATQEATYNMMQTALNVATLIGKKE